MKYGFKTPLGIKEGPTKKTPWNYDCPPYDERSSCYVNTGTNYGLGHKNPIGKEKASNTGVIPYGRPNIPEEDTIYKGKPGLFEVNEHELG